MCYAPSEFLGVRGIAPDDDTLNEDVGAPITEFLCAPLAMDLIDSEDWNKNTQITRI